MRALVYRGPGQIKLEDKPKPQLERPTGLSRQNNHDNHLWNRSPY